MALLTRQEVVIPDRRRVFSQTESMRSPIDEASPAGQLITV